MNKTLLLLAITGISLSSFAALSNTKSVSLRFVGAKEAYEAIEKQLGSEASAAVRRVDGRANALSIDLSHPDAARVREFLTSFDHRQLQVMVKAVVKRRVEATPETPAHDEVVSRPTLFGRADRPIRMTIPGERSGTNVELEITYLPGQP
jgi:hypothetical protein